MLQWNMETIHPSRLSLTSFSLRWLTCVGQACLLSFSTLQSVTFTLFGSYWKEPISLKKLGKGDDGWSTEKTILGWTVSSQSQTISLPQHCKEQLHLLLVSMLHHKRAFIWKWQKLLGELRSMALAIPGSQGCFHTSKTHLDMARNAFGSHL